MSRRVIVVAGVCGWAAALTGFLTWHHAACRARAHADAVAAARAARLAAGNLAPERHLFVVPGTKRTAS